MAGDAERDAQLGVIALLTASLEGDAVLVVDELEALVDDLGAPALHFAMFRTIGTLIADVANLRGISHAEVVQALARLVIDD